MTQKMWKLKNCNIYLKAMQLLLLLKFKILLPLNHNWIYNQILREIKFMTTLPLVSKKIENEAKTLQLYETCKYLWEEV